MKTVTKKLAPRPAPRRARLDVDERRAQLIALGLAAFAEQPYDDVSIDVLARKAGISKGLLYHYFPTKRDFYVAALDSASRQLLEQTFIGPEVPIAERLSRGLEAYLDFVVRHGPAFVALMRGGVGTDPQVAEIVERTRRTIASRVLETVPRELVTPMLRMAVRGWIGFVEATVVEWVARRGVPRRRLTELLSTVLVSAVQSAAGQALLASALPSSR